MNQQIETVISSITELTNVGILKAYRDDELGPDEARTIDGFMTDLSEQIIDALKRQPEDVPGTLELTVDSEPEAPATIEETQTTEVEIDTEFKDLLKAWMKEDGLDCKQVSEQAGVSELLVDAIAYGAVQVVDRKSRDKLLGAMIAAEQPPEKSSAEPAPETTASCATSKPESDDALEPSVLTKRLHTFKNDYKLSNKKFAKLAGVTESIMEMAMKGESVHSAVEKRILSAIADYRKPSTSAPANKTPPPTKAVSGDKPTKVEISRLAKDLKTFKKKGGHTIAGLEKLTGISNFTISKIFRKETVSAETLAKVRKVIDQPVKSVSKVTPAKPVGKGPGQFVQMKLAAWMGRERLDNASAATRCSLPESAIRTVQSGVMPHENILRVLASHIPDIRTNLGNLLSQVKAANK